MYRNWYIVGGHIITDVSRKVWYPKFLSQIDEDLRMSKEFRRIFLYCIVSINW